jgi:hypothetical protein
MRFQQVNLFYSTIAAPCAGGPGAITAFEPGQ